MGKEKEYSNGEVTVVWKPGACIHSEICINGLPDVFQPGERPWIKIEAASTDELVAQVKRCPSGALSYYMNGEERQETEAEEVKVEVLANGPLMVHGTLRVVDKEGNEVVKDKRTAFCRCGASSNKPYCDGSHKEAKFEG